METKHLFTLQTLSSEPPASTEISVQRRTSFWISISTLQSPWIASSAASPSKLQSPVSPFSFSCFSPDLMMPRSRFPFRRSKLLSSFSFVQSSSHRSSDLTFSSVPSFDRFFNSISFDLASSSPIVRARSSGCNCILEITRISSSCIRVML
ncbi:uncharacterized protein LOC129290491 [Prosopis cineraria]|uniref:uncharacterized protein LOC129290491 n=1 Tax=Prosopis cineraria TaxID=364024 RepID=UPI00240F1CEA|nr:uncharacterized protein LOC129290491 [Prosopis cineraria]